MKKIQDIKEFNDVFYYKFDPKWKFSYLLEVEKIWRERRIINLRKILIPRSVVVERVAPFDKYKIPKKWYQNFFCAN